MRILTCLLLAAAASSAGCDTMRQHGGGAVATLESRSGSTVLGTVTLHQRSGFVHVRVDVNGLVSGSEHGFHVHEKGDCSAPDALSAGGHFNPGGVAHGRASAAVHHAGDMPSLIANANGRAIADFDMAGATLDAGPNSLLDRAVVVHAGADDFTTQPSGNAGARVACGVIRSK